MSKENIIGRTGTIRGTEQTGTPVRGRIERGRRRRRLPASYRDGEDRYLPGYVIINGIQVPRGRIIDID